MSRVRKGFPHARKSHGGYFFSKCHNQNDAMSRYAISLRLTKNSLTTKKKRAATR